MKTIEAWLEVEQAEQFLEVGGRSVEIILASDLEGDDEKTLGYVACATLDEGCYAYGEPQPSLMSALKSLDELLAGQAASLVAAEEDDEDDDEDD